MNCRIEEHSRHSLRRELCPYGERMSRCRSQRAWSQLMLNVGRPAEGKPRACCWVNTTTTATYTTASSVQARCLPTTRPATLRRVTASSSCIRQPSNLRQLTMNAQELKNFLADSPPSTVNLEIKKHFEALSDQQKRYAHFISR